MNVTELIQKNTNKKNDHLGLLDHKRRDQHHRRRERRAQDAGEEQDSHGFVQQGLFHASPAGGVAYKPVS